MQQLVSHWKTLQETTTSVNRKKRRREPEQQPPRTKSKTPNDGLSNTSDQQQCERQSRHAPT
mgnify:FL=1